MDMCKLDDVAAVIAVFLFDDALQGNAAEVIVDGFVQVFPKVVRQTGRAVVAVGFAAALGGVQLVFGGGNDLGDIDLCGRGRRGCSRRRGRAGFRPARRAAVC